MSWEERLLGVFKANDVRLIVNVPDGVLAGLLRQLGADEAFQLVAPAREEEGIGMVCGAYLGGQRGAMLMQNSGLGNALNAVASLAVPCGIPFVMVLSQRGELGEFNPSQVPMSQVVRPALDALGVPFHTLEHDEDVERVAQGAIKLAFSTERPVALILSSLLTGARLG
jgi:sulfopyruvate decarboxylase alpha subunit